MPFHRLVAVTCLCAALTCCTSFSLGQTASQAALNSAGITQAMHQKMYAANVMWQKREGAGLQASLNIAKGKPTLFLEIFTGATAEELAARKLAIITALEFILADDGFDRVRVSITESTPRKAYERSVRDVEITRAEFQSTATTVANVSTAAEAVKVTRRDRTVLDQVYAQLGIK